MIMEPAAPAAKRPRFTCGMEPEPAGHTIRHRNFLTNRLEGMFNLEEMSDTTFLVGGEIIYASSIVLVAASDYFEAMLGKESFKERSNGDPIEIHDIEKSIFVLCLKYLYSGIVQISSDDVVPLLRAADMFGIVPLFTACGHFMIDILDAANCLHFFSIAEVLSAGHAQASH